MRDVFPVTQENLPVTHFFLSNFEKLKSDYYIFGNCSE